MKSYDAIAIIEDINDGVYSEKEYLEAWQHLVDTGLAWQLQGWYGRRAHALIEDGLINPPGSRLTRPQAIVPPGAARPGVFT